VYLRPWKAAVSQSEGKGESEMPQSNDRSTWVIGGTTLVGLGVGLIYLKVSVLIFIACIFIGIGAGLVITPFVRQKQ